MDGGEAGGAGVERRGGRPKGAWAQTPAFRMRLDVSRTTCIIHLAPDARLQSEQSAPPAVCLLKGPTFAPAPGRLFSRGPIPGASPMTQHSAPVLEALAAVRRRPVIGFGAPGAWRRPGRHRRRGEADRAAGLRGRRADAQGAGRPQGARPGAPARPCPGGQGLGCGPLPLLHRRLDPEPAHRAERRRQARRDGAGGPERPQGGVRLGHLRRAGPAARARHHRP